MRAVFLASVAAVLSGLLLPAAVLHAQEAEVEIAWKPGKERVARFYSEGSSSLSFAVPDAQWKVDRWDSAPQSYSYLYRPIVLHVPRRKAKVGDSWSTTFTLTPSHCQTLTLAGKVRLSQVVEDEKLGTIAVVDGVFKLRSAVNPGKGARVIYTIETAEISYSARIALREGAVVSAAFTEAIGGRYGTGSSERKLPATPRKSTIVLQSPAERLAAMRERAKLSAGARKLEPCTQPQIDKAIDDGVKFLVAKQEQDGSWKGPYDSSYPSGATSIALLALLKCGASPTSPGVRKAITFLSKKNVTKTYELGLLCMALHAYGHALAKKKARGKEPKRVRLSGVPGKMLRDAVKKLIADGEDGAWGYGGGVSHGTMRYDHSNTQYAVLGLRAAELAGVKVGPRVWTEVLEHHLAAQQPDFRKPGVAVTGDKDVVEPRGWSYTETPGGGLGYASMTMTCAGVTCMMIARERLAAAKKLPANQVDAARRSINDGLAWIAVNYPSSVRKTTSAVQPGAKPQPPRAHGYMLYGIERCAVFAEIQRFDGVYDWYQEGARLLLDAQDKATGGFNDNYKPIVGTAFALLFLKRATIPLVVITGK